MTLENFIGILEESTGVGWTFAIWDLLFLSVLLIIGILLRSKVKFFQKWLIPDALLAGLLGLILGKYVLGTLTQNTLYIPFSEGLAYYPYHLLNICFCSIPLGAAEISWRKIKKGGLSTGLCISFTQMGQVAFGVGIALIFIFLLGFEVSPLIGTLFMFGYGTGPGQAYAIGNVYENLGLFVGGKEIGLAFGSLGYVFAFLGGIPLMMWGIRNGHTAHIRSLDEIPEYVKTGLIRDERDRGVAGRYTSATGAIDTLSMQIALVLFTYIISILVYLAIWSILPKGASIYLCGFLYMICVMVGMIFRVILDKTGRRYILDSQTQARIQGVTTDLIVVSAIAAISIPMVWRYFTPFITIAILGGFFTLLISVWLHKRIFSDHQFERLMFNYGAHTGTAMSGLALMRVVDPEFKSSAPADYTMGMPLALVCQFVIASIGGVVISMAKTAFWPPILYFLIAIVFTIFLWYLWPVFGFWKRYKPFWSLWPKD